MPDAAYCTHCGAPDWACGHQDDGLGRHCEFTGSDDCECAECAADEDFDFDLDDEADADGELDEFLDDEDDGAELRDEGDLEGGE